MKKRLKNIIKEFYPLRYVVDKLVFCTPLGRDMFFDTYLITDEEELNSEFIKIDEVLPLLGTKYIQNIKITLSAFRDIRSTVKMLSNGVVLSEVDLFELKYLAYHIAMLKKFSDNGGFEIIDITDVFSILDPCNSKVVNFYIYDIYDFELAELRKKLKTESNEEIFLAIRKREEVVRIKLSAELKPFSDIIVKAIDRVAEIDLLIAKSEFIRCFNLARPIISSNYGVTKYENLFNIYLMDILRSKNNEYQKVDIDLIAAPTLITGANMSGKTMLLKSVALSQFMVQFGLFAPADYAEMSLVDDIFISIGDGQREDEGLSSFASEMLCVSGIIDEIIKGGKFLILLDELARTTSPREGAAIVDGVVSLLSEHKVMSLITTHYSSLSSECRCKRVKGFIEDRIDKIVTKDNISQFIDYSLEDDTASITKESEAVRIAEILGVNKLLIDKTRIYLEK